MFYHINTHCLSFFLIKFQPSVACFLYNMWLLRIAAEGGARDMGNSGLLYGRRVSSSVDILYEI